MINLKSLIKLSRKWQKWAAEKQRRMSLPSYRKMQSFVPAKGHFVVYTTDEKRFMVPLELLSKKVFMELFRLAESEFGLPANGPITLPCDGAFLENVIHSPLVYHNRCLFVASDRQSRKVVRK